VSKFTVPSLSSDCPSAGCASESPAAAMAATANDVFFMIQLQGIFKEAASKRQLQIPTDRASRLGGFHVPSHAFLSGNRSHVSYTYACGFRNLARGDRQRGILRPFAHRAVIEREIFVAELVEQEQVDRGRDTAAAIGDHALV